MVFAPSSSDAGIYYRKNILSNGGYYYKLLLVYVENVLAISHVPDLIMEMVGMRVEIKHDAWGPPTRYLVAGVSLLTLPDGKTVRGCGGTDG